MMFKTKLLLPLLPRLGLANIANVAGYRQALASGLIEEAMPARNGYHDPLFHGSYRLINDLSCSVSGSGVVDEEGIAAKSQKCIYSFFWG